VRLHLRLAGMMAFGDSLAWKIGIPGLFSNVAGDAVFYNKTEMSPASIGGGVYRRQEGVCISLLPNALLKCWFK